MMLNTEWENMPLGFNWYTESFDVNFPSIGTANISSPTSYQQYNGKEGINMMSMLFCKCGGIINAIKSGQDKVDSMWEDFELEFSIWEDFELELLEKFYNNLTYENWSPEKKLCAEGLWKKRVEEEGIDPIFVAGLIGNVFAEGAVGMLQGGWDWKSLGLDIERNNIISKIDQARIACGSPDKWGVGMIQWSFESRKKILLSNYEIFQSEDGTLTLEQLVSAECETILDELYLGKEKKGISTDCKYIYPLYVELEENDNKAGDKINFSTCFLFKEYIRPSTTSQVNKNNNYTVADGVLDKALKAKEFDDVPSIYKRIIAAKLIYEHFTGET